MIFLEPGLLGVKCWNIRSHITRKLPVMLRTFWLKLIVLVHHLLFSMQLKLCNESSKTSHDPTDNWSLVSSGLSALANMARDTHIRNKIAEEQQWWQTSVKFLVCILRVLLSSLWVLEMPLTKPLHLYCIDCYSLFKHPGTLSCTFCELYAL